MSKNFKNVIIAVEDQLEWSTITVLQKPDQEQTKVSTANNS